MFEYGRRRLGSFRLCDRRVVRGHEKRILCGHTDFFVGSCRQVSERRI
jgi:hypothetical protein